MFDRLTEKAKHAMGLARKEAQWWQHDYIGTEHILIGITTVAGVAWSALGRFGITLAKVRNEVGLLVKRGVTPAHPSQLPFTPRAKKVLELSLEEASNLGHTYIGTEHLLLGLIRENDGIAAQVLRNVGVTYVLARERILAQLGHVPSKESPVDKPTIVVFESAEQAAQPWRWHLKGVNGEIMCHGEGHGSKVDALRAALRVAEVFASGDFDVKTG